MRKLHLKVVLDVFVEADDDADVLQRMLESEFTCDSAELDEVAEVQGVDIVSVEVTDSR